MANTTQRPATEKKGSYAPFIIIILIFAATVAGIYFITESGGKVDENNSTGNNTTANTSNEPTPLPNYATAPPGAPSPHFQGSENSPVTVEEFADFQCPTCAAVYPRMKEVTSKFGSKIKVIWRNYPLTNLHRNSYDASVAAEAAGMQGKFWDMQNLLFTNQPAWANSPDARKIFDGYAERIGLDVEKFKNDMLGFAAKGRVDEDMRRARALNITATPTILINGAPVTSLDTVGIEAAIQAEINRFEPKKETPSNASTDKDQASDNSQESGK